MVVSYSASAAVALETRPFHKGCFGVTATAASKQQVFYKGRMTLSFAASSASTVGQSDDQILNQKSIQLRDAKVQKSKV